MNVFDAEPVDDAVGGHGAAAFGSDHGAVAGFGLAKPRQRPAEMRVQWDDAPRALLGDVSLQFEAITDSPGGRENHVPRHSCNLPRPKPRLDTRQEDHLVARRMASPGEVPQDPRLRDVVIHPHALDLYDQLQPVDTKEDNAVTD